MNDTATQKRTHFTFLDILIAFIGLLPRLPGLLFHAFRCLGMSDNRQFSFGQLIGQSAKRYATRTAIKFVGGNISYQELDYRINQAARVFIRNGVRQGDIVTVLADNSVEVLICFCALARIGAIAYLLNPTLPLGEMVEAILRCRCRAVVSNDTQHQQLQGNISKNMRAFVLAKETLEENDFTLSTGINFLKESSVESGSEISPLPLLRLRDPVVYIGTSGTEGPPKLAVINHRRLVLAAIWFGQIAHRTRPVDVIYCPLPLYHATASAIVIPMALAAGASMVLPPKFSSRHFWEDIRNYQATIVSYIGEMASYLLQLPVSKKDTEHSVECFMGNGLRTAVWETFQQRFGIRYVREFYGASESPFVFSNVLNLPRTIGTCLHRFVVVEVDESTSLPIRTQQNKVVKVKKGHLGLLLFRCQRGDNFQGYVDHNATNLKLVHDVERPGDTWFNTGDVVLKQGFRHVRFIDRLGDTYRWKGENISARQVENTASELGMVQQAVVYGISIPHYDGKAGMIAVLPAQGGGFDPVAFGAILQQKLPLAAVPVFLRCITSAPITETFKAQKIQLKKEGVYPKDRSGVFMFNKDILQYVEMTLSDYTSLQSGELRI